VQHRVQDAKVICSSTAERFLLHSQRVASIR
jgi:hypothetical protein